MRNNGKPHQVSPGDVFGRLTVTGYSHNDKRHRRFYTVDCVCGTTKGVQGTLLRSGNTKSCGCLALEVKAAKRLPDDAGIINQIILQYKRHARDRGIIWALDRDTVSRLVRCACHYCGTASGNTKRTKNHTGFSHNGLDRMDSSKGYHSENVVACCGVCNIAKGGMSHDEFIAWAARITNHRAAMAEQWGAAA